jgi:hypothetical protein
MVRKPNSVFEIVVLLFEPSVIITSMSEHVVFVSQVGVNILFTKLYLCSIFCTLNNFE